MLTNGSRRLSRHCQSDQSTHWLILYQFFTDVAVSSNPKDWKLPYYLDPYAAVEGNDVAGLIEEVGEGVTDYKKGDKVAAFSKMRTADKYGAYAEYTVRSFALPHRRNGGGKQS